MTGLSLRELERLSRPQRAYFNDVPITDVNEALHLLNHSSGYSDGAYRLSRNSETGSWEVVAPWYSEGDSGGDSSGLNYYQIDQELAERLEREGLVTPRQVKHWGWTETIHDELVVSPTGQARIRAFEADMRAKAESLLTPGVHTDLTGELWHHGSGREHREHGRLYFDFKMPDERVCRVYPEEGLISVPDKAAA